MSDNNFPPPKPQPLPNSWFPCGTGDCYGNACECTLSPITCTCYPDGTCENHCKGTCQNNLCCPDPYKWVNNQCVQSCGDTHCQRDETCCNGTCCSSDEICTNEKCVQKPKPLCGKQPCPNYKHCCNDQCVSFQYTCCDNVTPCPFNQTCCGTKCCQAGYTCHNGDCIQPTQICTRSPKDLPCPAGEICISNYCVPTQFVEMLILDDDLD